MKKSKGEQELTVKLLPQTAKDLITVLMKFSNHKHDLLAYGATDQADRLLALNLFRVDVENALRKGSK